MATSRSLGGCELWPVPGLAAMGVLETAHGLAPVALAGPRDSPGWVVIAGESLEVVRGLYGHAARKGLGVIALRGTPGAAAADWVRAAIELAHLRGAERVALAVQGGWTGAALRASPGAVEGLVVLDPKAIDAADDPQRLSGIPLWIASGTDAAPAARALHAAARHPRSLIELVGVGKLDHAVSDVAAEIVPFLRHALLG